MSNRRFMTKARIIIVDYNSQPHLGTCIAALASQTDKRFEVVIVNNGDAPIKRLTEWKDYKWLSIIETGENTGFAGGSNLGAQGLQGGESAQSVQRAKTDWVITLNPDAWPEPDWFETLMAAAEAYPTYSLLSSTLLQQENPTLLDGAGEVYSLFGLSWRGGQGQALSNLGPNDRDVLGPCGAAAAYKRDIFIELGGFDEGYFCFLEDIDLALRFQLEGHKCLHVREAYVHHIGGGSSDGNGSAFQMYHSYKNQIRVITRNTPPLLFIPHLFIYYASQIWFTFRAARQPHWKARVKGLWHGFKSIPTLLFANRRDVQKRRVISTRAYWRLLETSPLALRRKDIVPK